MAEALGSASWTQRADLRDLVAALGPGNARWVGGAVRDALLGVDAKDVDCATPLHPEEVMRRLKDAGIRLVPTGLAHGTITAILPDGPVEITTLRKDVSTDGRRATVEFAGEWQEDAGRRDFTMNALYADPDTLEIFDYFGGQADLEARLVRFIGDARQRIREDHLRILRYYRFQARFGAMLDGEAEEACADLAQTLKGLSRERVASELLNLLGLPEPQATVLRMFERGVLPVILPETGPDEIAALANLISAEASEGIAPDATRRLAALLPPDPRQAGQVASRLRLSNAQKKRLSLAAERPAGIDDPRGLAYRLGMEAATDRLLLSGHRAAPLDGWAIPVLPLKGGDIVRSGVAAGPDVARILQAVEGQWIAEGFPGEQRVSEILRGHLPA